MKKGTRAILGFALGLVVIVSLASVAFSQKGSKRPPTPEPVWGARIPAYANISGMEGGNHLYTNDDPNVSVRLTKNMTGTTVDNTTITFFIYANSSNDQYGNPLETYVSFSNVVFSELVEADVIGPGGVCGFPPFYNVGFPNCLPLFLNSDHPKQGYEHVMFRFRIDADLDDETLFPPGQRVKYMGSGAITIYLWNSFEPLTADDPFPYHTVIVHLAHMCTDGDKGYYITKLDDGTWELNLEGQTFDITQSYTWKEVTGIGKNRKPIISITSYTPQSGLADFAYKFIIIKNPK